MNERYQRRRLFIVKSGEGLLLVHPRVGNNGPVTDLLRPEPKTNLLLGALNRVRAVADVTADFDAEITTDGTRKRVVRASLTEQLAARTNNIVTLPGHADNGAGRHVLDQAREERLGGKVGIVLFEKLLGGLCELHGNKLESLLFESLDNLTDEPTLDAIGLDHDIGAFRGHVWWL